MISDHEFSLGRSCPVKVLHSRARLPRNDRVGGIADWMHTENGKVRALALQLFSDAVQFGANGPTAAETGELIAAGKAVARGRFATDAFTCEVDFVVPDGATLRIFQVATRAVSSEPQRRKQEFADTKGRVSADWRPALERLAFRWQVVRALWPRHRVLPFLVVPVRGRSARIEGLHGFFSETAEGWDFAYPSADAEARHLLTTLGVTEECRSLEADVVRKAAALQQWQRNPCARVLGYACKKCQFRVEGQASGFERCWGPLARVTPHMFDLAYMYFIKEEDGQPVANRLAREGKVSLWDIPVDLIDGDHADRQFLQLDGMRSGRVIIDDELKDEMARVTYPLHFIDVESIETVVPPHRDCRIGSVNIFQLSVHRRDLADADLIHTEWLNTEREAPNRKFLGALRSMVGDHGTVLVWSNHERKCFNSLLAELIDAGDENDDLFWLKRFLSGPRLVDMHQMAYRHVWYPGMAGRTSLKWVLPAVWAQPTPVKAREPYAQFPADTDPYTVLTASGQVSEGCAAMKTYLEMQSSEGEVRARLVGELLEYCGVDTLAMAFCWDVWEYEIAQRETERSESPRESALGVTPAGSMEERSALPIGFVALGTGGAA